MGSNKMGAVDWAERLTGPTSHQGTVYGIEAAAKVLRSKSGECFAAGRDDYAKSYRQAAEILEEEAKERRKNEYWDRLQEQQDEAWIMLGVADSMLDLDAFEQRAIELGYLEPPDDEPPAPSP